MQEVKSHRMDSFTSNLLEIILTLVLLLKKVVNHDSGTGWTWFGANREL